MRKLWIGLTLTAVVPALLFYVLDWTGLTDCLRYVSTTSWRLGDPSLLDIGLMFLSVFTWAWVKGFIYLFGLAALPFAIADLSATLRKKQ